MISRKLTVGGKVQGVGFRPFVFRLAYEHGLTGWVKNTSGQVEILLQGPEDRAQTFESELVSRHPPLAEPHIAESGPWDEQPHTQFRILKSLDSRSADVYIPADFFTCDDCLWELMNPDDRRYRYPFINCTNCGPRYTLIAKLPYDRPNTSMANFVLCDPCQSEYSNPYDRRFHAQPLACPDCGPTLQFHSDEYRVDGNEASLQACVQALKDGRVLAVKGVGGYHLMCDAGNEDAVARLRERKNRPDKPFAVLFPWQGEQGMDGVREHLQPDDAELAQLKHVSRAIVLVKRRADSPLAHNIHPGLDEIGAMLPYSPLHHLISHDFGAPLVATSGNFTGEPVITDNDEAEQRLAPIVDGFVHHNRPILRPADDSVVRVIDGQPRPLRLGRGMAPLELELPFTLEHPLLAVGGHMKNTIALAWNNRVIISPHIGDLSSARSMAVFEQVIDDLQHLYEVYPNHIACDTHPEYGSHRWARQHSEHNFKQLVPVLHHHAHAGSLCGEFPDEQRWLVFTWDGTGLGDDDTIWGGEALLGEAGDWQRVMSLRPLSILGGDKASLQPWRSAAALCWDRSLDWHSDNVDTAFAHDAWQKGQGCFQSSAAGRLFDAAASLIMNIEQCSFDGQAPMQLEQRAGDLYEDAIRLPIEAEDDTLSRVDWSPLVELLLDEQRSVTERSTAFHSAMAMSILDQALAMRERHGDFSVGLSGGVFQNRKLTEFVIQQLRQHDFRVFTNTRVPCNDAGVSFGQIIEAHRRIHL